MRKLAAALIAAASVFSLAGCGVNERAVDNLITFPSQSEETTSFHAIPLRRAWINAPGMTFAMQRFLVDGAEQRIGLINEVPVPGDNTVVIRSRAGYFFTGGFSFEEFMRRVGGPPAPFTDVVSGEFITSRDSLGDYFWTEKTFGNDIVCVLALRRVSNQARHMPDSAMAMDIMLRNCLRGTTQDALAPIAASNVGIGQYHGLSGGSSRMLSPLAAPSPLATPVAAPSMVGGALVAPSPFGLH